MDELFAVPGAPWVRVDPALAKLRHILLGSGLAGLLVLCALAWLLIPAGDVIGPVVALTGIVLVAAGWVVIGRNARSWAYAERDEDLFITRGVLYRRLELVPYGRMQFVDVTAGPLERWLGIATVRLHTASPDTRAHIPGLRSTEAGRLRDRLTELGEAQAAGL
ncbi:MAG: PH domain-containing protein [Nocardioidaceae bacterium]